MSLSSALAANYPLEIIQPRPSLDTKSRFYKAYPGILYEMRMGVIGGDYPFLYELTISPAGMTINADTGLINWSNPVTTGSPHTVTARVTDLGATGGGMGAGGTQVSVTWTITVTTTGFLFVDAVDGNASIARGGTGTGSISNPFLTMKDVLCITADCVESERSDTTYKDSLVYLRTGTYIVDGPVTTGSSPYGTVYLDNKPVVWIEYPGGAAVLDFSLKHTLTGGGTRQDFYFDGFELINQTFVWELADGGDGRGRVANLSVATSTGDKRYTFWRLTAHGTGPTALNVVAGRIYIPTGTCCGKYVVFQDNEFYDDESGHPIVTYEIEKTLFENNYLHDSRPKTPGTTSALHGLSIKGRCRNCELRGNRSINWAGNVTGTGNRVDADSIWIYGQATTDQTGEIEVRYNMSLGGTTTGKGLSINEGDHGLGTHYVYRNTFLGRVYNYKIITGRGPLNYYNNVIINTYTGVVVNPTGDGVVGDHVSCGKCTDPTQIVLTNNLTGVAADNIIDANGDLTVAYAAFLGTRGHQLGGAGDPGPDPEPGPGTPGPTGPPGPPAFLFLRVMVPSVEHLAWHAFLGG